MFKRLIIAVTSTAGKDITFFCIAKENYFLDSTIECELCVYGQEIGETERITRFYFVHN
jgi:hypothetical protein